MDDEMRERRPTVDIMEATAESVDLPYEVKSSAASLDRIALDLLRGDEPFAPESVHKVRVTTKRLRAHWNLVRPELGKKRYRKAKERLRLAARRLAGQRDATVILATLDELAEQARSPKLQRSAKAVREVAAEYLANREVAAPSTDAQDELVGALETDLSEWSELALGGADATLLEHGLRETYGRARRLGRYAARTQRGADFHRWRRWTKYLMYQLEVLVPLDPERLQPYLRDLKRLGKLLGKSQDFAVAKRLVSEDLELQEQDRRRVLKALERSDRSVIRRTRSFRDRLFDKRPGQFVGELACDMGLARGADG
jgi:CHAD domain-containing protein